jgi:hypothetical protein
MPQKSIITTRALMTSLTILSIGMMFIATSSVFAASSDLVHLSIVRAQSSDRGCVRIKDRNSGQVLRDVSIPQKNQEYDAGTYPVGTKLALEIHNGGRCEDNALSTQKLTLKKGSNRPKQSGPFTYEAVFTVDQ